MKILMTVLLLGSVALAQSGDANKQESKPAQCPAMQDANTPPKTEANKSGSQAGGDIEILTDTNGVDLGPYMRKLIEKIRDKWYSYIPESARPPQSRWGEVRIQFEVGHDGKVDKMKLLSGSGDISMDRAAWGGIVQSSPFDTLPQELKAPELVIRMRFKYNPTRAPR